MVTRNSTFELEHAHAAVAHDVFADRATKRGGEFDVARAGGQSVFKNNWRGGSGFTTFIFRYGDDGVGGFHGKFHVAEFDLVSGSEPALGDAGAVEKGAVGGIRIAQINTIIGEREFGVMGGHSIVGETDFAFVVAPDAIDTHAEFNRLYPQPFGSNKKSRHKFNCWRKVFADDRGNVERENKLVALIGERILREGEFFHDFAAD